jgi:hypothetical protein
LTFEAIPSEEEGSFSVEFLTFFFFHMRKREQKCQKEEGKGKRQVAVERSHFNPIEG